MPHANPTMPDFNYPAALPVSAHRDAVLAALRHHAVVIVSGDTGSGKTTQLPKMALEHLLAPPRGPHARAPRVACTQPRRLAAVTMAERVAAELKSEVGALVGYQHRYARKVSPTTQIKFLTDGVLLAETRADPLLRAYDVIIVDEAHERSLNIDFLLGILKRLLARRRDLKVIVSSATLDTARFAAFFDGAPIIAVPGRRYPIEIRWRPPADGDDPDLPRDIAHAVAELPPADDILVFLPGERDIRETADHLARARGTCDDVIPLLASLPAAEQRRAFQPSARRRIILATNVAETSVTIPGIRCVIDSGLARVSRYIHRTQIQRLQIEPISQASARQRAGRCGRLGPGVCVRLYAEDDFAKRDPYTPPEVLRSSLAGVILAMLDLRLGDIEKFPFIDPPKPAMVREGLRELLELGAITHTSSPSQSLKSASSAKSAGDKTPVRPKEITLTERGRTLAKIPVEPRLARMLLAAAENAVLPAALPLVAALSCDDPRRRPIDKKEQADQQHARWRVDGSDFLGTLSLWLWWEREGVPLSQAKARRLCDAAFLSFPKMREWRDLTRQLETLARRLGLSFAAPAMDDEDFHAALHRALLSGLLGRIGRYNEEDRQWRGTHGLSFALHPSSALAKSAKKKKAPPPWVMAGELVDTARLFARHAAEIDPRWIEPVAGPLCKHHVHSPEYDPVSGFVRATEQVTLHGLVIVPARRCDFTRHNPALAREIFIRRALIDGDFPRPPPPVRDNAALLKALRERADKARRPDFFDADRLLAHFQHVIPADVASADALRKWLQRADDAARTAFRLRKNDWWPSDEADSADFPDTLRVAGAKLALSYRHAPGEDEDGLTCTVARADAAALRLWRADWLVPGMLPEKLAWLIASLPSALRRVLSPVNDTVAGLLAKLKPGDEPLLDAVRRVIGDEWGYYVPPDAWTNVKPPPHLRVRYRIRDDKNGRILAASRDLDEALRLAGLNPAAAASVPARESNGPVTTWIFGALSERNADGTFPALHDDGSAGVSLRLYADAASAAAAHTLGVTRLFLLNIPPSARVPFRRKSLPLPAQLTLKTMDYSDERLSEDILAGAVREALIADRPPIRDAQTFRARLDENSAAVIATQTEISRLVAAALAAAAEIESKLSPLFPETTIDSVQTQLAWLVFRGFPRHVPLAQLRHYARYLKGTRVRLDRALTNPSGDLAKEKQLAPYWELYEHTAQNRSLVKNAAAFNDYRWLLEEYRVSLFAQELHTPIPVSPKRLTALYSLATT